MFLFLYFHFLEEVLLASLQQKRNALEVNQDNERLIADKQRVVTWFEKSTEVNKGGKSTKTDEGSKSTKTDEGGKSTEVKEGEVESECVH